MKVFVPIITLGFLLVIISASDAHTKPPVAVTFDQLFKSPVNYQNQVVRITGQVDNCISLTCNLCPADMTNATFDREKCLGLEFSGFQGKTADVGVSELMERAFRFATVEIDTRFDPTCLSSYEDAIAKEHPDRAVVCTDRASVLLDARVVEVLSRKSALDGIVSWYDFGKLLPSSAEDERDMRAELDAMNSTLAGKDVKFSSISDQEAIDSDASKVGLACVCREKSCEGRWPSRFFGGFQSIANPFSCLMLAKLKVGWRVLPEEDY